MATSTFGWVTPNVGGSSGTWGTTINEAFEDVDGDLASVQTTANAALPKAGGTMTGEIVTLTQVWTHSSAGNISAAHAFDLDIANSFSASVTGNVTLSFSNVPTGACFVTVALTNGGGVYTVTWPGAVLWAGGTEPSLAASGTDILTFYTYDSGTTWYGALAIANAS